MEYTKGNLPKLGFGHTISMLSGEMLGVSDCHAYGSLGGCDEHCPVLIAGLCKLQDDENKELYKKAIELYGNDTRGKS